MTAQRWHSKHDGKKLERTCLHCQKKTIQVRIGDRWQCESCLLPTVVLGLKRADAESQLPPRVG
jgi:hypothetical protein